MHAAERASESIDQALIQTFFSEAPPRPNFPEDVPQDIMAGSWWKAEYNYLRVIEGGHQSNRILETGTDIVFLDYCARPAMGRDVVENTLFFWIRHCATQEPYVS